MEKVCLGVDFGGTFIKFGWMDETGRFGPVFSLPTPPNPQPEQIVEIMARGVREAIEREGFDRDRIVGVGIGAPGPLSVKRGVLLQLPNLKTMKNFPLRDRVAEALNLPTCLENDANAAAYAEYLCGAGKGTHDVILLTLGTGVGGGIVLEGDILHGANEMGAELGHILVEPGGRPCPCGQHGCLEQYTSAMNMARYAVQRLRRERPDSLLMRKIDRDEPIDAKAIHQACRDGDAFAREIWEEMARYLALGCVTLCRIFDPDRIILAGGMTKAGEDLLEPIRRHWAKLNWTMLETKTQLTIATLGNDAGAIGAAGVAWKVFGEKTKAIS